MRWLITGGAGFIGTNSVLSLHARGEEIVIIDNLSRPGVLDNSNVILERTGLKTEKVDISDRKNLFDFLEDSADYDVILNLAGQVSLLESIRNPIRDFEVNAIGPLNLLEHLRLKAPNTLLINMSSNKVYGSMAQSKIIETSKRYEIKDRPDGFAEDEPLDFHGPYGCSKGTADQYLNDYRRIYGLKTISLRQSAVYGPFQKPMSDQGWLAFMIQEILADRIIALNGVGKQVRDLLHVDDLIKLFIKISESGGCVDTSSFNVGGGSGNQISILELFDLLDRDYGLKAKFSFGDLRPGDQKYFVSNNSAITSFVNWRPETTILTGIGSMLEAERQRVI